ncbi:MAG: hypothetical protein BMS9Abin07_1036 [Acidimicrobiia bacterium]|nr:MAG: hypothetical protein BMS9Abin07_1036 [Acidimicrobiia bacterium]
MPPRLPDRYRLNVRLGADGDVEEWLATDEHLERPVLVRFPGPAGTSDRMDGFLKAVRAAAATSHPHVQKVFAAGEFHGSAFAVAEWDGAVTVADRLEMGETIPVSEYLPNAAGLAEGLSAFHSNGGVHGAIDAAAIHFSAAHPARLAGFGRVPTTSTQEEDTVALAHVLRTAITGSDNPWVLPSQVVEGLPRSVDDALTAAAAGSLDAAELAAALRAIPFSPRQEPTTAWSPRGLLAFAAIALAIIGLAALGLRLDIDPDSPFLYPAASSEREPTAPTTTIPVVLAPVDRSMATTAIAYDPLGDGAENNDDAEAVLDGDRETSWQTEHYPGPLPDTKAGVGLVVIADGPISAIEISGSRGTRYTLGWASDLLPTYEDWQPAGSGTLLTGITRHQVPAAEGAWLIWLTDLPEQPDGTFAAEIWNVSLIP